MLHASRSNPKIASPQRQGRTAVLGAVQSRFHALLTGPAVAGGQGRGATTPKRPIYRKSRVISPVEISVGEELARQHVDLSGTASDGTLFFLDGHESRYQTMD